MSFHPPHHPPPSSPSDSTFPQQLDVADFEEEEEDPEEVVFESSEEFSDSDAIPTMFPHSPLRHGRHYSNPIEHFENLAFAFVNPPPPHHTPHACVRRALQTGAGSPPVAIRASSHGAGLVIFGSGYEREVSIMSAPFHCPLSSIGLVRNGETEIWFLFGPDSVSALNIEGYPIEYWFAPTIVNSVVPFACPIEIDPICLTGVDYSAVLIAVKRANGERGFYRIPMRPAGSPRLVVANLASCSIGYLDRVATVGPSHAVMTDADIFCKDPRGRASTILIEGEDEVLAAIDRFDGGLPLIPATQPVICAEPPPPSVAIEATVVELAPRPASPPSPIIFYTCRGSPIRETEEPSCLSVTQA
ncbi:hypothetical protein D1007_39188 [Hordeum vulgare]|nr:hypothetical protein D1007_39188 [Hordeum vulgare]